MAINTNKIHAIIHTASVTAGGIGAGLAQLPGADMPALAALQTAMIIAIGHEHGCEITKANAKSILLTFPASYGGRALSQFLVGWIPGYGNAINASTAITITETIGWAADSYFEKERDEECEPTDKQAD
ncbi:MAG: hypothetical protein J0665_13875 [Deltaproteobacteria bacterium]|nr:hypothetical protein [Deltaproteobacteria bacterium]